MTDRMPGTAVERWREITRLLTEHGLTRAEIDAIETEEDAWQLIEELSSPPKANGHSPEAEVGAQLPDPERPRANDDDIPSERQAPPLQANGDAAEAHFDDDAYELPIADPDAARIVAAAVKAMRSGTADKLKAITDAARQLDPITQMDAIDFLSDTAIDILSNTAIGDNGLHPDAAQAAHAVQAALEHGQKLREQDRAAGRLGKDRTDDGFLCYWHGEIAVDSSRPWLVYGTIAEVGCGLWSGQWGTHKTFGAQDLAVAVMTGTPIFDSEIDRRGGVLFYAAEGESEVPIRIQAAIENRSKDMKAPPIDPKRAPFAWLTPEKLPLSLLDPKSVEQYIAHAKRIDAEMRDRYGVPLVLQILDTVVATAGYGKPGDENDPVIGKRLMREWLRKIGHETRSFALGVDHFGKEADTGTRGASSKEDNADTVLASLASKDISGTLTNTRVAVRKVRGGVGGREYSYSVRQVPMGLDAKSRPQTTLVIDWAKTQDGAQANPRTNGEGWGTGIGMATLRKALLNADTAKATKLRPWGAEGPEVTAFPIELIKAEFYATYPAKGETPDKKKEATRKAWDDSLGRASQRDLIGYRLIDDAERIWLGGKSQPPQEPKP